MRRANARSPDAGEDSLSISVASPSKNAPSWEVFGIRIDVDAGVAAFSNLTAPQEKGVPRQANVYELASGQEASSMPLEKGWHARGPVRFSHIFNFAGGKTYNPEWAKEQAKSKVLRELSKLKVTHRTLDPKALADLRKSPEAGAPSGDWIVSRTIGDAFESEANYTSFANELGRFGIRIAGEVPRQEFLPAFSALRSSVDAGELASRSDDARVQAFTTTLKERLLHDVPAAGDILKEGMLSEKSIDLASHLEGLWRWDVEGHPLWLLEGIEAQGSGGFAEINSWLLNGDAAGGKVEAFLGDLPEEYNPHITDVDDNAIRLKARLYLGRYFIAGMSGPKVLSVTDLRGQLPHILLKNIPQADLLADVRLTSDARHVIQINSDGRILLSRYRLPKSGIGWPLR